MKKAISKHIQFSILLSGLLLAGSCKKDSDTSPSSDTNSNPTAGCRLKTFMQDDFSGKKTYTVRYDSKGRIVRWAGDSILYNDAKGTFAQVKSASSTFFAGKINSQNQFTFLKDLYGNSSYIISYNADGTIKEITDSVFYDFNNSTGKYDRFVVGSTKFTYDANSLKNIVRTSKDSVFKKIACSDGVSDTCWLDLYKTVEATITYNYSDSKVYKTNPLMSLFGGWVFGKRSDFKVASSYTTTTNLGADEYFSKYFPTQEYYLPINLLFGTGEVQQVVDGTSLPKLIDGFEFTYENCN